MIWRPEPAVKTDGDDVRIEIHVLGDDGNRHLHIGFGPHDLPSKHQTMFIFKDAHGNAPFHIIGITLPFSNPAGILCMK